MEEQIGRLEAMREERDKARAAADEMSAQMKDLQHSAAELQAENLRLRGELEEARASAAAYEQAKERLAALEIESAKRAGEVEQEARKKAEAVEKESQAAVSEVNFSLENIRRETLRMKDRLRSQIIALEASVDDFSTLARGKQEYLSRFLPEEGGKE
jgi:chromosome segregation ATPase